MAQDETFNELLARAKSLFRAAEGQRNAMTTTMELDASDASYRQAAALLEKGVMMNPSSQEAHYFLAYTHDRLYPGDPPEQRILQTTLSQTLRVSTPLERVLEIDTVYHGELLILSPRSKIASEWGSLAAAYAFRGERDSAIWAFKQGRKRGGFHDALLAYCRNILASCDRNAILLVGGDLDTFPLWYLQLIERVRRDITVINLSLCNTHWYASAMHRSDPFGSARLPLGYLDAEIDTLGPQIIDGPISLDIAVRYIPSAASKLGRATIVVPGRMLNNARLLDVRDLVVLDVLKKNNGARPFFVSVTVDRSDCDALGLTESLAANGLAECLVPAAFNRGRTAEVYADRLARRLIDDRTGYSWSGLHDPVTGHDPESMAMLKVATGLYLINANHQHSRHNRTTAIRLLQRMESALPLERIRGLDSPEWREAITSLYDSVGMKIPEGLR